MHKFLAFLVFSSMELKSYVMLQIVLSHDIQRYLGWNKLGHL